MDEEVELHTLEIISLLLSNRYGLSVQFDTNCFRWSLAKSRLFLRMVNVKSFPVGFGLIFGLVLVVIGLGGEEERVGVEVDEETGLEDVKFLDLGVQLALLMSISGVSPSLEVDSFPLSGDAAAFSRSLSDRLISLLLSLLLVLLLNFEVFSRSLVEEDLTGERQEDAVDEEEGKSHRCLRHSRAINLELNA